MQRALTFLRQHLAKLGLTVVALILAVILVTWSGVYNVAASAGHWTIVDAFLRFALHSSVRTYSLNIETPTLDSPALVRRGAGHFAAGCAPCHGAPRDPSSPIVARMLPQPPSLSEGVSEWKPRELFFIVKHGLKFTGMPGWVSQQRDDEVWSMVAFVQRLPSLSRAEYTALAFGAEKEGARSAIELARFGPFESEIAACARCHGLDGQGFADGAFPKIGGQSEAYLLASLEAYARGERPSGIMQPATAPLSADERRRLASYYAGASRMTTTSIAAADPRLLALGQRLVQTGAPERGIPACAPCHGPGTPQRNPLFPELVGQHARAIEDQLALWRKGLRQETPLARIMAPIGQRLSEEDARAVALYYATAASSPPAHTGVESGAPQR